MIKKGLKFETKYGTYDVIFEIGKYSNGRLAITFLDFNTGEDVLTATVNMPREFLEPGEVIIKDYSENEGVLDWLMSVGVITEALRTIKAGYCEVQVCKINAAVLEEYSTLEG